MCGSIESETAGIQANEDLVRFLDMIIDENGTYEVYQALTAADARCYLEGRTVRQKYAYLVVETPEGIWGRDSDGLYLEALLPEQLDVDAAQCVGTVIDIPSVVGLDMASRGHSDNFLATLECGKCGFAWSDGIRYRNRTAARCPGCGSLNLIDTRRLICFQNARDPFHPAPSDMDM